MRKSLLFAALGGLALAGCRKAEAEGPEPFGRLSLDQVSQLVGKPGVAIYDDNSEDSYEAGHVPGAKHLGVSEVSADRLPKDKGTELVFYCANPH
ncbi:MAG TPA: rhodanese-like domain-containing protein [Myxococcales bacterium]|nr:rhodanese-like domain-containing protein [Myxococcales bacterium]